MAKHVVLQDWSGEIGSLPAGEILDDAHYNVAILRSAGVAHVPFEDGMQPFIDVFLQVSRGHSPNVQLLPILRAAGFLGGGGAVTGTVRIVAASSSPVVLPADENGAVVVNDDGSGTLTFSPAFPDGGKVRVVWAQFGGPGPNTLTMSSSAILGPAVLSSTRPASDLTKLVSTPAHVYVSNAGSSAASLIQTAYTDCGRWDPVVANEPDCVSTPVGYSLWSRQGQASQDGEPAGFDHMTLKFRLSIVADADASMSMEITDLPVPMSNVNGVQRMWRARFITGDPVEFAIAETGSDPDSLRITALTINAMPTECVLDVEFTYEAAS